MKQLLTLFILSLSFVGFSQDEKKACGDLPMLKVDVPAVLIGEDLNDQITSSMHSSLKEKGEHKGIFKMYVDCNGDILKLKFDKGNLDSAQQKSLYEILEKTEWTGAILDEKSVTTIVFVTVEINNGQVNTIIQ